MSAEALPSGYVRSALGVVELVARDWAADALRDALRAHGSLHRWAGAQADREPLRGRDVAWATTLGASGALQVSTPVVVRHSRHGGLLAGLTGDVFVRPTRAPLELATAARLATGGVATPEVVAYTVHPVAGVFARSDVMTRRLPTGSDFPDAWRADASAGARAVIINAVAVLLRALSAVGAHHPDLNVKNVYVAGAGSSATAYVLDVDRVTFAAEADAAARNFARLARSIRKWNDNHSLGVGDDALVRLASLAWVDS